MEKNFNDWEQLLYCKRLNNNELRVLMLILSYHIDETHNSTSHIDISRDSGMSIGDTISAIKVLEARGLITFSIFKNELANKYDKIDVLTTKDYIPNYERIQEMMDEDDCSLLIRDQAIIAMRKAKENFKQWNKNLTNGHSC